MSKLHMSHTGRDGGLHFWLLTDDDTPVAYAKVYERTEATGTVINLCDIETRAEYRNQGYATRLLAKIAEGYAVDAVTHSGSFTSDGANYVARHVNRPSWAGEAKANCEPMSFVEHWDTLTTKFN